MTVSGAAKEDIVVDVAAPPKLEEEEDLPKEMLKGGDDDQEPCFPWCYTKGPCGCILMLFFMAVGLFCWAFGWLFKCFVCVVTCPCPGSTICNCLASLADKMLQCPAGCGKCVAGSCPC
ncbi:hypothetical protein AAMO2058_001702600 [Amorphochlora amoebiformis]|mmetsp:Transcript_14507/g.23007  ORF Transcript_14507/g.23007 Transcript_14507/m.23007 type:complete len:119 (-) Transcript_14507:216-572(-)